MKNAPFSLNFRSLLLSSILTKLLSVNQIKKLSCEDLQLIDHLWLKFSGGHFGFSVQKKIYLQCGGKADYNYYREAEQKWEKMVGWRANDSQTLDIKYSLYSPLGHLPMRGLLRESAQGGPASGGAMVWVGRDSFFSRIKACGL